MLDLDIGCLQDEGVIFVWVTGGPYGPCGSCCLLRGSCGGCWAPSCWRPGRGCCWGEGRGACTRPVCAHSLQGCSPTRPHIHTYTTQALHAPSSMCPCRTPTPHPCARRPAAGRAMELGRECLKKWGYRRVDELVWIKTNQLQRLIRTGRTGHWLNHSKVRGGAGRAGRGGLPLCARAPLGPLRACLRCCRQLLAVCT